MRRVRVLIAKSFLVLTTKGVEFVETWFGASGRVPPHLTKLYQLLLHTVSMGGVISFRLALKAGYSRKVIKEAVSKAYIELTTVPKKCEKRSAEAHKRDGGSAP